MIVKNEEAFLADCLRSVQGVVDEMVIVDTGSTDRTIDIARDFGARLIEIEWPNDFSKARNVGLDAVTTPWVLVMDADEELVADDRDTLRRALTNPTADAYNIRIISLTERAEDITESYVTRVLRSHPALRFSGSIHEQLFHAIVEAKMNLAQLDVRLTHKGYLPSVMEMRNKQVRNRLLLEQEVARHPNDVYTLWQLSQTYFGSNRPDDAIKMVRRALKGATLDNPLWVLCMMTYARALVQAEQPRKALRVVRQGQLARPNYTDFWYFEGGVLFHLGDWERAEASFQKCLALGEAQGFLSTDTGIGGFKSLYRIAQCRLRQDDPKTALAYLLLAIKQQPQYRSAWRAIMEMHAGNPLSKVLETIELSLSLDDIMRAVSAWPQRDPNEEGLLALARDKKAASISPD